MEEYTKREKETSKTEGTEMRRGKDVKSERKGVTVKRERYE